MTGKWREASFLCWAGLYSLVLTYILASIVCRFSKTSAALKDALIWDHATSKRHPSSSKTQMVMGLVLIIFCLAKNAVTYCESFLKKEEYN